MENIFVEFLPPWVETGLQPAFYDKESGTVLQQTARMYARVNMLIRMFNKLSKQTKETVEEYINKFNELHDYVQDYFANLDVQQEINVKLEAMAEDGTLADIIADYIQLKGVLAYNTVADLKLAENLVDGSFAQTYGYYTVGDGGQAKYKIRTITNDDVIDDMFIIEITGDPTNTLVAELVNEGTLSTKQVGIKGDNSTDETTKLQKFLSYTTGKHIISAGTYIVSGNLNISSNSYIFFDENATIKLTGNSEDYQLFNMLNVNNVTIENGNLIGNRLSHTPIARNSGFLYSVMYSQDINIINCTATDAWADGFYVGNSFSAVPTQGTKNVRLFNCYSVTPGRSGYSICGGENIRVIDCETDTAGVNPGSGIDIETEGNNTYSEYIALNGVNVENFKSKSCKIGVSTYNNDKVFKNVVITNHISNNDVQGSTFNIRQQGDVKYVGAIIKNSSRNAIYVYENSGNAKLYIKDIIIDGCTAASITNDVRGIDLYGTTNDYDTLKDITIDNVDYINTDGTIDYTYIIYQQHFKAKNLTIKNMALEDKPNLSFNTANEVKIINCDVKKNGIAGNVISQYVFSNNITDARELTANKVLTFNYPMPNGLYRYNMFNTGSGYSNAILFANDYEVRKAGTVQSQTYIGESVSTVIEFVVNGNKVSIVA